METMIKNYFKHSKKTVTWRRHHCEVTANKSRSPTWAVRAYLYPHVTRRGTGTILRTQVG